VISLVRFFYDPSKKIEEYFVKARELVDPLEKWRDREDFIILVSGLNATHPVMNYVPEVPDYDIASRAV
jgi:hypothetical protein